MKFASEPYKLCWVCGYTEDEAREKEPGRMSTLFVRDDFTRGRKSDQKHVCWVIQECNNRQKVLHEV